MVDKWRAAYNPKNFEGKMDANSRIGWSAENYIAQCLSLKKSPHGKVLPDLQGIIADEIPLFVEVKSGKDNKGLIYVYQMFFDDILNFRYSKHSEPKKYNPDQETITFGSSLKESKMPVVQYAFVNNLNKKGTKPESKEGTMGIKWGNVYFLPHEIVRAYYHNELLKKRGKNISEKVIETEDGCWRQVSEKEIKECILKTTGSIKKGVLSGMSGQQIIEQLENLYEEGLQMIDPEYFNTKGKDGRKEPRRFENLIHNNAIKIYNNDNEMWSKIKFFDNLSFEDYNYEIVIGPENSNFYLMEKNPDILLAMKQRIIDEKERLEKISRLRDIFLPILITEEHESKFTKDKDIVRISRKLRKNFLHNGNPISIDSLVSWKMDNEEATKLESRAKRILTPRQYEFLTG